MIDKIRICLKPDQYYNEGSALEYLKDEMKELKETIASGDDLGEEQYQKFGELNKEMEDKFAKLQQSNDIFKNINDLLKEDEPEQEQEDDGNGERDSIDADS